MNELHDPGTLTNWMERFPQPAADLYMDIGKDEGFRKTYLFTADKLPLPFRYHSESLPGNVYTRNEPILLIRFEPGSGFSGDMRWVSISYWTRNGGPIAAYYWRCDVASKAGQTQIIEHALWALIEATEANKPPTMG